MFFTLQCEKAGSSGTAGKACCVVDTKALVRYETYATCQDIGNLIGVSSVKSEGPRDLRWTWRMDFLHLHEQYVFTPGNRVSSVRTESHLKRFPRGTFPVEGFQKFPRIPFE